MESAVVLEHAGLDELLIQHLTRLGYRVLGPVARGPARCPRGHPRHRRPSDGLARRAGSRHLTSCGTTPTPSCSAGRSVRNPGRRRFFPPKEDSLASASAPRTTSSSRIKLMVTGGSFALVGARPVSWPAATCSIVSSPPRRTPTSAIGRGAATPLSSPSNVVHRRAPAFAPRCRPDQRHLAGFYSSALTELT